MWRRGSRGIVHWLLCCAVIGVSVSCTVSEPTLDAVYSLAELDARELPVLVSTSATTESRSTIELLTETLTLRPDRTFALAQLTRQTVNGDSVATIPHERDGRYSTQGGVLTLQFNSGERSTFVLTSDGEELRSDPRASDVIHGVLIPAHRLYKRVEPR
jgi:hypothetical protein